MCLGQIPFNSLIAADWIRKPWGVTFHSDKSFGAVMFLRSETEQGIQVRLVEYKAKLTPLDQKGEPVKAEICGAVFAVRLGDRTMVPPAQQPICVRSYPSA